MQKVAGSVRTNLDEMKEVSRVSELTAMEVQKLDALVAPMSTVPPRKLLSPRWS